MTKPNAARPPALPIPARRDLLAFTPSEVFERWGEEGAGVRALSVGDNVITMFDQIGENPWTGGGVTAKKVAAQLRAIAGPVEIHINSGGGDMFEGLTIYNMLREHPHDVTIKVLGVAASAASIIAMAGTRIEIGAASSLMIHNCWVIAAGNRHDMRETAEWLETFDGMMNAVYVQRTGLPAEDIAKMLDAETWLEGTKAVEMKFANALLPADQLTIDEAAKAEARHVNELRGMERTLIKAGLSREEARERVDHIRGARDAAPEPGERDAADLQASLAVLLQTIRA